MARMRKTGRRAEAPRPQRRAGGESNRPPRAAVAPPLQAFRRMWHTALAHGWPAPAALCLLVLVSYLPAMLWGDFIWDDLVMIGTPAVREATGLRQIWFSPGEIEAEVHYWPLVYSSFWLQHKLWGFAPAGYHVVNVLLHLANTLLLWQLLRRSAVPGAWLAAAVFAVHPVHVESVAWVIELKDVLSGLFYLSAALAWIRFDAEPRPSRYLAGAGTVRGRDAGQVRGHDAAGGAAHPAVVEAGPRDLHRPVATGAVLPGRGRHHGGGPGIQPGPGGRRLRLLDDRACADRRACPLVLPRQAVLAARCGGHLSALGGDAC